MFDIIVNKTHEKAKIKKQSYTYIIILPEMLTEAPNVY